MNIEIIDYQLGYVEVPINGIKLLINNIEILDIDNNIKYIDIRVELLKAVLKHLKIDANVYSCMDFD